MSSARVWRVGVSIGFLCLMVSCTLAAPARAAWVNSSATQFQVGGKLAEIVPTAAGTSFQDPTCGTQGGTSLALVRGSRLAGVDAVGFPIVLVTSCLDNSSATNRSRLNFVNPVQTITSTGTQVAPGTVVKQLTTTVGGVAFAPSNGWAHLVHRPDKGDLLGCGADGSLYSIDYSQFTSAADGTATKLTTPALSSCGGLAWDAQNDTIYQGLSVNGNKIGSVVRFKEGATTVDGTFTTILSCPANGLAISGGTLLVSCAGLVSNGTTNTLAIQRLDKNSGVNLALYSSIFLPVPGTTVTGFLGLTSLNNDPGLGDLACDPATFQHDASTATAINPLGRDMYRDAVWSRRGLNGNGVAAMEFPAFTCGLPSNSVVTLSVAGVSGLYSPLAAGLSMPVTGGPPGQFPLTGCFDSNGIVIDSDGDGLPDCWETNAGGSGIGTGGGIDFDGDGTRDFTLCAQVNINGDGTTLTTECADPKHKDLFVEIDYMQNHKPDPQALSQKSSVTSVGVQSVREAFAAAPASNPDGVFGIRLHMQVDEQVTFTPSGGGPTTSHVNLVSLTPCTGPTSFASDQSQVADFDVIKNGNSSTNPPIPGNFGTAADRASGPKTLNAKRLAFRYALFAHSQVAASPNPNSGVNSSGCSEVGGDDAIVTLGAFATGGTDNNGTTDYQAGTFMHEFGHLLGLQHGGDDTLNCKPNYRSVMSYPRQFSGSPITGRRLDYSRHEDPNLNVALNESSLNECTGIGSDPTLQPIPGRNAGDAPFFSAADQIAFGPGAWSVVTPTQASPSSPCTTGQLSINWNRITSQGKVFQTSTSADLNGGSTTGCDTSGSLNFLLGFNDWANILYRASAAIDFAGGVRSDGPVEMTKEQENALFLAADRDGNGVGDGQDCGAAVAGQTTAPVSPSATTVPVNANPIALGFAFESGTGFLGSPLDAFTYGGTTTSSFTGVNGIDSSWPSGTTVLAPLLCPAHQCGTLPDGTAIICQHTHRIDIKPSASLPKIINLGTTSTVTIAIFSEILGVDAAGVQRNWDAPGEIKVDATSLAQFPLTFTVENISYGVKTNTNGSGTCSVSDVPDPFTGVKDGLKDLKCQFPTNGLSGPLPTGTHFGVVTGFFLDPLTNQFTEFSARQEVTILP
jgi:hypothetical protein